VSATGAYRFVVEPGEATTIDVEATLYPRRTLTHVGLAPLTSMFLHGPGHHRIDDDFRPAVHDSDGLAIFNGNSECIWRPLTNPRTLQTSTFLDKNVKGFGLCQRARSFHSYEDLEARYEKRPSLWIEPKGTWGAGYVELIEIPTSVEIHDNIAAYWKPANGPAAGAPFSFGYRMYWTDTLPIGWSGASTAATRVGRGKRDMVSNINFFMNVPVEADGALGIVDGISAPGLTVDVRAEMDVDVVVSNCPQINIPCNGFNPTPVRMIVCE